MPLPREALRPDLKLSRCGAQHCRGPDVEAQSQSFTPTCTPRVGAKVVYPKDRHWVGWRGVQWCWGIGGGDKARRGLCPWLGRTCRIPSASRLLARALPQLPLGQLQEPGTHLHLPLAPARLWSWGAGQGWLERGGWGASSAGAWPQHASLQTHLTEDFSPRCCCGVHRPPVPHVGGRHETSPSRASSRTAVLPAPPLTASPENSLIAGTFSLGLHLRSVPVGGRGATQ